MYRRNPWRRSLGGMSGGVFLIGMAIAFITGAWLPVLFVTLAVTSLLGAASSGNPNGLYGGLYSFLWLAGLALCFVVGFWPWILIIVGLSAILGAMRNAIMATILGAGFGTMYNANRGQAEYSQSAQNMSYTPSEPTSPINPIMKATNRSLSRWDPTRRDSSSILIHHNRNNRSHHRMNSHKHSIQRKCRHNNNHKKTYASVKG